MPKSIFLRVDINATARTTGLRMLSHVIDYGPMHGLQASRPILLDILLANLNHHADSIALLSIGMLAKFAVGVCLGPDDPILADVVGSIVEAMRLDVSDNGPDRRRAMLQSLGKVVSSMEIYATVHLTLLTGALIQGLYSFSSDPSVAAAAVDATTAVVAACWPLCAGPHGTARKCRQDLHAALKCFVDTRGDCVAETTYRQATLLMSVLETSD